MKIKLLIPAVFFAVLGCSTTKVAQQPTLTSAPAPKEIVINGIAGYKDTPMEPDGKWHVHDPDRPQPIIVTPGTFSEDATPPSDAVVLFDGKDLSHWRDTSGNPAPWKLEEGTMVAETGDIVSTEKFADMQLHLEFKEPIPDKGAGQDRGNSGVFLFGLYEVQVLDCYSNKTYADGTTGAIYGQHPPLANACRPPGEWQTYDIIFTPPHFDAAGKLQSPACVTVFYNGVAVQNHQSIRGNTHHRTLGVYTPVGPTAPIRLQFHHHPVRFRNIWARSIAVDNEP
jgi:hypothetical protein